MIRDIDTRTDTEKAVNDLDETITNTTQQITEVYKSNNEFTTASIHLLKMIKTGKIHAVKWSGK